MAQPPIRPTQSRQLVRSVPFVTPRTFLGALGVWVPPAVPSFVAAQFDTLEGFADPNLFNNVLPYPATFDTFPGPNVPVPHAVGPWLDAAVFATGPTLLRVEYAVDRGCAYRLAVPDTSINANTFANISGLRITARFVRVSIINNNLPGGVPTAIGNVEFGIYVRSA